VSDGVECGCRGAATAQSNASLFQGVEDSLDEQFIAHNAVAGLNVSSVADKREM
jgi:hypothetical protein